MISISDGTIVVCDGFPFPDQFRHGAPFPLKVLEEFRRIMVEEVLETFLLYIRCMNVKIVDEAKELLVFFDPVQPLKSQAVCILRDPLVLPTFLVPSICLAEIMAIAFKTLAQFCAGPQHRRADYCSGSIPGLFQYLRQGRDPVVNATVVMNNAGGLRVKAGQN